MRGAGQIAYLTKLAEPDVAVVVNAGTAHIELLGSTDAIARAKAEIWSGVRPGGTIVRPAGDLRLEPLARAANPAARHVTFGDEPTADVRLVEYTATPTGADLVIDAFGETAHLHLALVGRHAAIDACAALAAAHAAGASIGAALAGLARARPPSMRGEIVDVAGRHVIVDCYNANPASMAAALRTLAERGSEAGAPGLGLRASGEPRTIAVLGDMLELGDHAASAHAEVGELANQLGVSLIALGELASKMPHAHVVADPSAAAARALAETQPGDWILLKASRGMRLERVLSAMLASPEARSPRPEAHA
jgi:UDP-N-acetylmuramyl pentapeptide synthase